MISVAKPLDKATATEIKDAMSTIVDMVNPVGELTIVYYLMTNMPKALGMNKEYAKRTANDK